MSALSCVSHSGREGCPRRWTWLLGNVCRERQVPGRAAPASTLHHPWWQRLWVHTVPTSYQILTQNFRS